MEVSFVHNEVANALEGQESAAKVAVATNRGKYLTIAYPQALL